MIKKNMSPKIKFILCTVVLLSMLFSLTCSALENKIEMNWKEIDDFRSYNLNDITVNDDGQYLIVGFDGLIRTSNDLKTWEDHSIDAETFLTGCAWGNSRYVVVGEGTIAYSADGTQWEKVKLDKDIYMHDVKWLNNKFMAVGAKHISGGLYYSRYIMESEDGVIWNTVYENKGEFEWHKIKCINNKYIAFGFWENIAISEDGVNWTVRGSVDDDYNHYKMNDYLWDGSEYIAVDSYNVYTSSDLVNWKMVSNIKGSRYLKNILLYKNAYYLIYTAGYSDCISQSTNLVDWEDALDQPLPEMTAGIENNGKLIVVGWDNSILATEDGYNWGFQYKYAPNFLKVKWNGGEFLVTSNDGSILKSKDGSSWEVYDSELGSLIDVVWTGSQYIAMSYGGSTLYNSVDGIKWNDFGKINCSNIDSFYFINKRFFALGSKGEIYSSLDAVKWAQLQSNTENWLRDMAWNGSQYVCVGMFGTMVVSKDGINWTVINSTTKNDLNKVIWNGKEFIITGGWETIRTYNGVAASPRKSTASGISYDNLVWNGKECLIVSRTGEIYTTVNGKVVNEANAKALTIPYSVAWNGETYVMVGNSGTVAIYRPNDIIKVKVDGVPTAFDIAPQNIAGYTMIPAKAVFEKMGASVAWDSQTKTVTVTKNDIKIEIIVGSKTAKVNGQEHTLDAPATCVDGRTLVPVRFVAEALGAKVDWDNTTKTVIITQ